MPKYACRTDDNHTDVRRALEACGWTVLNTFRAGQGFPDLIAIRRGVVRFIEVKDGKKPPSERKLTDDEVVMHARLATGGADVRIVTDAAEVATW